MNFPPRSLVAEAERIAAVALEAPMPTKLQLLIRRGPNPNRGLTALVLANHSDIKQARQWLWPWTTIAENLDLPAAKARALSAAYRGVERRLKAQKVRAAAPATATPRPATAAQAGATPPATPPMPGQQKPTPTEGMSEMDQIRSEFK